MNEPVSREMSLAEVVDGLHPTRSARDEFKRLSKERTDHQDHSRKIGLRCAEALIGKWPTLHLDGFDVDMAAILIGVNLPTCMTELELDLEQFDNENPPVPVDTSRSIGSRLRKALGVDGVSTIEAIEIAIIWLSKDAEVRARQQEVIYRADQLAPDGADCD